MPKHILKDLTGQTFNRLTVVSRNFSKNKTAWNCACSCGNTVIAQSSNLKSNNTKSCGCLNSELIIKRNTSHGMTYSAIYNTWTSMKQRCYDINAINFERYGARGIIVCSEWKDDFPQFYIDMGDKPSTVHSIERIDNSLGYSPSNCKWATPKEQCNNRRSNKLITINNKTDSLTNWCKYYSVEYSITWKRLNRGWPISKVFPI